MNKPSELRDSSLAATLALALPALAFGGGADVDSLVLDQLRTQGRADIFVKMSTDASLAAAESYGTRASRGQYVYDTLTSHAELTQQGVRRFLDQRAITHQVFWINNSLLIRRADRDLVNALAARPDVAYIRGNHQMNLDLIGAATPAGAAGDDVPWGVSEIRAPDVWDSGNTGVDVVVASFDTGVRYTHQALVNQYRGNNRDGTFTHAYNWFDPSGICGGSSPVPCDNVGSGTHTMGIMVGGDGRGPFTDDIGVAPGATWMAAKACESFSCSDAALIESAQWIACPTDGSVPDCTMAPDVVHSAWGETAHDLWFATYVNTWRAAGIIPVFPAGSAGSSCRTIGSPADYPNLIAVGATTESDVLADFSSKGPGFRLRPVKPDLVAPGSDVRSSTNTSDTSYGSLSGSQMGSAHVAGAVALLLSADPTLTYRDVLSALQTTTNRALDAPPGPDACAGIRYNRYPNMIYGFGQIDAAAALGLP